MMRVIAAAAGAVLALAPAALSQETYGPFDPRSYAAHVHGDVTEVYVLGTAHLAQQDGFDPAVLSGLLDRLEALAPDVITIEALGPETIFLMQAYDDFFGGAAGMFASAAIEGAGLAGAALALTRPAARLAVEAQLADWPQAPSSAQRRHLAALFAASGDIFSAVVQWRRLAPEARTHQDAVTEDLAALLDRVAASNNENVQIAVALAVRLGHERVYPADDHSAIHLMDRVVEPMTAALETPEFAVIFEHPIFTATDMEAGDQASADAMLDYLRRLNSAEYGHMDAEGQWRVMIDRAWPEDAGRVRMAEWDARNLRMAAHIRAASADAVGGRVLVVVGAAHKPWLDAYLDMMTDMRIGDMAAVLDEGR